MPSHISCQGSSSEWNGTQLLRFGQAQRDRACPDSKIVILIMLWNPELMDQIDHLC